MRDSSTQQRLSQLLAAELTEARNLADTLDLEYEALCLGDAEQIARIAVQKQQQTVKMAGLLQQRDSFLVSSALPPGRQGMDQLTGRLPTDSAALGIWRELRQFADELRKKNEVNGSIIAHSQRHLDQAVAILSGQTGTGDTYGPRGKHCAGQVSQALAKA